MFKKIALLVLVIVFLFSGMAFAQVYERSETLYTGGKQWGPVSTGIRYRRGLCDGNIGLCYETLFLYDHLTDKYHALARGEWKMDHATTYELKIRQGRQLVRRQAIYSRRCQVHL